MQSLHAFCCHYYERSCGEKRMPLQAHGSQTRSFVLFVSTVKQDGHFG